MSNKFTKTELKQLVMVNGINYSIEKWDYPNKNVLLYQIDGPKSVRVPMYQFLNAEISKSLGIKWIID